MIRKTLTILSLIGLLLSVGLWGTSYWKCPTFDGRSFYWSSCAGAFHLMWGESALMISDNSGYRLHDFEYTEFWPPGLGSRIGYYIPDIKWAYNPHEAEHFGVGLLANYSYLVAPYWLTIAACAVIFALSWQRLRRKRKKLGLCLKCGYDLRASKDRCPECGEEFVSTGVAR
ncbi:MAG: hypothetical protein IID34_10295 [Planctomycetes bacterium]|nr:hypothetical protein [Planctomycetota bacterium]